MSFLLYPLPLFCSLLRKFCMKVRSSLMLIHLMSLLATMNMVSMMQMSTCHTHQ